MNALISSMLIRFSQSLRDTAAETYLLARKLKLFVNFEPRMRVTQIALTASHCASFNLSTISSKLA